MDRIRQNPYVAMDSGGQTTRQNQKLRQNALSDELGVLLLALTLFNKQRIKLVMVTFHDKIN